MENNATMLDRFGGWALMVAGAIFAIGLLLHPDETASGFAFNELWSYVHMALGVGFVLALYGLVVYFYDARAELTRIGKAAVLALIGTYAVMSGVILFVEGIILPTLGTNSAYASLLSESGPLLGGGFGTALMALLVIYSVSSVAAGYAIANAETARSSGGWFLLAAPLIAFAPPLPYALLLLGGLVVGAGHVMIGFDLLKGHVPDTVHSLTFRTHMAH